MRDMTLEERVIAYQTLSLPGQPQFGHMGTSYLISDLHAEVLRLRDALTGAHVVNQEAQRMVEAAEESAAQVMRNEQAAQAEVERLRKSDKYESGFRDGNLWGGKIRSTLERRAAVAEVERDRYREALERIADTYPYSGLLHPHAGIAREALEEVSNGRP